MEGRPVFPLKTKGSAGRRLLVYTVQVYLLAVQTIQGETSVMDVRAAVAIEAGKPLEVTTVQLEGPREGEVLIEVKATGICHTDAFTLSGDDPERSEAHTSELQSLMRNSYAVFCSKKN